jgi:hypothetical protein
LCRPAGHRPGCGAAVIRSFRAPFRPLALAPRLRKHAIGGGKHARSCRHFPKNQSCSIAVSGRGNRWILLCGVSTSPLSPRGKPQKTALRQKEKRRQSNGRRTIKLLHKLDTNPASLAPALCAMHRTARTSRIELKKIAPIAPSYRQYATLPVQPHGRVRVAKGSGVVDQYRSRAKQRPLFCRV